MPFIIDEKLKSRAGTQGEGGSKTLEFFILWQGEGEPGTDAEVEALLKATAPTMWGNLPLKNLSIVPVSDILWDGVAEYGMRDSTYDTMLSFDTSGGSSHITQSITTIGRHGPGAVDLRGAIGVTSDSVDGVDITIPAFTWKVGKNFPVAAVTNSYIRTLIDTTGTTNSAVWGIYQPGEVLFLGAAGRRDNGVWNIEGTFSASPNRVNFSIGGYNVARKGGWDYLWCLYSDIKALGSDGRLRMGKRVVGVYVEQVYPQKPFAALNMEV